MMKKFTFIIFIVFTIIFALVLRFYALENRWYYYVPILFVSSFIGSAFFTHREKFNIKELKFEKDIVSENTFFTLTYIGKSFNEFSIAGYLPSNINITPQQLQLLLYKDTKQKEILPSLLKGENVSKSYIYQGKIFDVTFLKNHEQLFTKNQHSFDFKNSKYKICISSDLMFYWINFSYLNHHFYFEEDIYNIEEEGIITFLKLQNSVNAQYFDLVDIDYSQLKINSIFALIWYTYDTELEAKVGSVKSFKSLQIKKIEIHKVCQNHKTQIIETCNKEDLNSLGILF